MKKTLLTILLFLVMFYIPFLNKAVHIDDSHFIVISKALDFPLSVSHGRENILDSSHPPFIPLYLKITSYITGYEDYRMHAVFLIFPAVLLFSTLMLAKELDIEPVPAVMIICGNIALLPVSHNLMADGPMFSLWMLSAYFLISGINRNMRNRIVLSFLTMALAGLISYQTFLLLPVFLFYLMANKKLSYSTLLMVAIPLAVISLILIYISMHYSFPLSGAIHEIKRGLQADRLFNKGLSIPINIGVMMLFILPLRYKEIISSRKYIFWAIASFLIVVPPVMSLFYTIVESSWLVLLAALGIFSILYTSSVAFNEIDDRRLGLFLLSWFTIVLFFNIFLMPFGALRYLMPAVAPMAFILLRGVVKDRKLMASGVLTALLGLAVASGDYIYASSYRDFSNEVKRKVGSDNNRVWYKGEWGMHHYMDKNGFRYLASDSDKPMKGDLIIIADIPKLWNPSVNLVMRMELVDVVEVMSWYPVRIIGLDVKAGYYSTLWGYQPFTFSYLPVERFGIYSVTK